VLVHCKSGADRAGFMATLYLLLQEGRSLAEAKEQLSLRYGHFRFAKTGILDAFLEAYQRDGEAKGVPFLHWVAASYDPDALQKSFRSSFWSDILVERLIRRE
jgi:protein tyrosine/serine phosphatase